MRLVRAFFLVLALLTALLLPLIAMNLARFGTIQLERFREPTLALYACLALYAGLRGDRADHFRRWFARLSAATASAGFFRAVSLVMLGLYLMSAVTQHWAFRTYSHDFSMIDEALDQSLHGRFLFSPVLGTSFLGEHFSPILALFVPLHALAPNPYLLVLIQPLALWSSGLVLRAILRNEGIGDATAHVACLIYWNHAIMVSTLNYLFHMECFLPLAILGMFWFYRRRAHWGYALCVLLALSIKEDVGLYLAGFSVYAALVDRRRMLAAVTAAVSLAWVAAAVGLAIPHFSHHSAGYAFASRWARWGHGPLGVFAGYVLHPGAFFAALLARPYLSVFISLLLLPFASPWGWILFVVPWVLNATSSLVPQAELSLYYGIPVLAFAELASVRGLRSKVFESAARSRLGPILACLAIALNVSDMSFPTIPRTRGPMLQAIDAVPRSARSQLMPCFYPVAGYARNKEILRP